MVFVQKWYKFLKHLTFFFCRRNWTKKKWQPFKFLPLAWPPRRSLEASPPTGPSLTNSPLDQSTKSRDPLAWNAQPTLVPPCQQCTRSSSSDPMAKKTSLRSRTTSTYWMQLKKLESTCLTLAEPARVPPAPGRSRKVKLTRVTVRFLRIITLRKVMSWLVLLTRSLTVWSIPTKKRNSSKSGFRLGNDADCWFWVIIISFKGMLLYENVSWYDFQCSSIVTGLPLVNKRVLINQSLWFLLVYVFIISFLIIIFWFSSWPS